MKRRTFLTFHRHLGSLLVWLSSPFLQWPGLIYGSSSFVFRKILLGIVGILCVWFCMNLKAGTMGQRYNQQIDTTNTQCLKVFICTYMFFTITIKILSLCPLNRSENWHIRRLRIYIRITHFVHTKSHLMCCSQNPTWAVAWPGVNLRNLIPDFALFAPGLWNPCFPSLSLLKISPLSKILFKVSFQVLLLICSEINTLCSPQS